MYADFRSDAQHEHDIREAHPYNVSNEPLPNYNDDLIFTLHKLDDARQERDKLRAAHGVGLALSIEVGLALAVIIVFVL